METDTQIREAPTPPAPAASPPDNGPRPNVFAVRAKRGLVIDAPWWEGVLLQNAFQIIQGRYDL